jgi:hypothetical protein
MEGWMFVLASLVACNGEPTSDLGTVSETPGGDYQVSYEDVGVACVRSAPTGVEVTVDFGDCYACSEALELSCDITVEADVLTVHATGAVVVRKDCDEEAECTNTTAFCSLMGVDEGAYILSYADIDIPVGVPDAAWVCTGTTDVL